MINNKNLTFENIFFMHIHDDFAVLVSQTNIFD